MRSPRVMTCGVLVLLVILPRRLAGQEAVSVSAPTVTLDSLYRVAKQRNLRVVAAASRTRALRAMERSAGLPPDPVIEAGAMNLSLPDLSASMPTSMAPTIQAMQMLPIGKLGLKRRLAEQSTEIASASAAEEWWAVRGAIAMRFHELWQSQQQIVVMQNTRVLLQSFLAVARAKYAAGEGNQMDVLRASVEVTRMSAEIKRMEAMRTAAEARLRATLNWPSEGTLGLPVIDTLAWQPESIDTLLAWAESTGPMLARARLEVAQAANREKLSRRELWPDLTVSVQYGQRRSTDDMGTRGTERMGGFMMGFNVPVFARQRQLQMREEARAMADMSAAEQAAMRADVRATIEEITAILESGNALIALYGSEVIPEARGAVQSALSAYRAGQVDFMTLLDAQMAVNEYEQELAVLRAGRGTSIAELEMAIGRDLPRRHQTTVRQ